MQADSILFEIHITITNLPFAEQNRFIHFCLQHEAKPLLIELSKGECVSQPMFSKVVYLKDLQEVLNVSTTYSLQLKHEGFTVNRLKIETLPEYAGLFTSDTSNGFKRYYEWHGKINYERSNELLALCENNNAHLSINALKITPGQRFITLREFGDKLVFDDRIKNLTSCLNAGGWQLIKQQSEYCIYDNNCLLDAGWLAQ